MTIYLKNTLSGKKEEFKPLQEGVVKMYHCGPTVYSRAHIGNLRAYVFADTLRRMFLFAGFQVKQVINITDVGHLTDDADEGEDKVEKEAKKQKLKASEIAQKYTKIFLQDLKKLNVDVDFIEFPKASEYIDAQIAMILTLQEKGYTYQTKDGIYFDTSKFKKYGKLGQIDKEGLKEGARIGKNKEKKNPTDFALWKFSKKGEKRQQEWNSPWGVGFPGWHIECSSMIRALLGSQIDIHTGGIEHIPVHHNNEIAQSECATGKEFVKYWLHIEHLLVDGKKMSKSLGNIITLDDVIEKGFTPDDLRMLYLGAHYSKQLNFTWNSLEASARSLERLRNLLSPLASIKEKQELNEEALNQIQEAIFDDVNTPALLSVLWDTAKNKEMSPAQKLAAVNVFSELLGIDFLKQTRKKQKIEIESLPKDIQELIEKRQKARKEKNYNLADKLRKQINQKGYTIVDYGDKQEIYQK